MSLARDHLVLLVAYTRCCGGQCSQQCCQGKCELAKFKDICDEGRYFIQHCQHTCSKYIKLTQVDIFITYSQCCSTEIILQALSSSSQKRWVRSWLPGTLFFGA